MDKDLRLLDAQLLRLNSIRLALKFKVSYTGTRHQLIERYGKDRIGEALYAYRFDNESDLRFRLGVIEDHIDHILKYIDISELINQ